MRKPSERLTKRFVQSLQPDPDGRDLIYFDKEIRRYGVRIKPSGVKSYVIQYRNKYGQARRYTIGQVHTMSADMARKRAIILLGKILQGADPSAEKRHDRQAETVNDLCDRYLEDAKQRLKPNSLKTNSGEITHHIRPLLGKQPIATLTAPIVKKFIRDVEAGKTARRLEKGKRGGIVRGGSAVAFRVSAVLSSILQQAVTDGALRINPLHGIKRPKQQPKRPPPFEVETIARLGDAIRQRGTEGERIEGLRAIRFLLLSGCRRTEVLTLRWGMVDAKARCLRLPDTKTGPAIRPLGRAALEFLASFEPQFAKPEDYVFPGGASAGHFNDLPRVWTKLCERAKITGASIHSLRHWYASCGVELNISELLIAGLLGHRVRSVTGRYASAPDTALLSAADRVALRISETLDNVDATRKVVPMERAAPAA